MNLAERTWTDADDAETDLAVLPVGSTEQHGPHAPLGTDTVTATAVATAGTDRYDGTAIVAPAVPVGVAEEHAQFPGTLWASPDTFRSYVRDIVKSLSTHGWNRIVVVNGHGGNVASLREVCGRVTREGETYAVPFTWFDAVDIEDIEALAGDRAMGHGGPVETSLVSHLRPDLVHGDRFEQARDGGADGWGEFLHGVNLSYDSAEFTASGIVGDPSSGSSAVGEQLLAAASERLAELLETVERRDIDRPERRHSEER
ncbi:MAG: creatininase family protein [Halovenus sp.]